MMIMTTTTMIMIMQVRETLRFAAQLRLDECMRAEERYRRADDVMQMLGLAGVADVLVGNTSIKVWCIFVYISCDIYTYIGVYMILIIYIIYIIYIYRLWDDSWAYMTSAVG